MLATVSRNFAQKYDARAAEIKRAKLIAQQPRMIVNNPEPVVILENPYKSRVRIILDLVCQYYGVSAAEICGPRRLARLAVPRQTFMFLAYVNTSASLPKIGNLLGRDHTTILHGYNVTKRKLADCDPLVTHAVRFISYRLDGSEFNDNCYWGA
jgi:chromosomal replication initiation ATPase DnaA